MWAIGASLPRGESAHVSGGHVHHAFWHMLWLRVGRQVLPRTVVGRVSAEGDLQVFQELVHARQQRLRRMGCCLLAGNAIVHDYTVREVSRHDEVMLYDEGRLLAVHDEALDDLKSRHQSRFAKQLQTGRCDRNFTGAGVRHAV